jgi:hypothetical protein
MQNNQQNEQADSCYGCFCHSLVNKAPKSRIGFGCFQWQHRIRPYLPTHIQRTRCRNRLHVSILAAERLSRSGWSNQQSRTAPSRLVARTHPRAFPQERVGGAGMDSNHPIPREKYLQTEQYRWRYHDFSLDGVDRRCYPLLHIGGCLATCGQAKHNCI